MLTRTHECSAGSQNAHQPAQTFTSHPNAHPRHPAPVVLQHNETSANKFFPDPDLTCRLVSGTREGGFVTAPVSRGPGTSVGSVALTQRGSPLHAGNTGPCEWVLPSCTLLLPLQAPEPQEGRSQGQRGAQTTLNPYPICSP